MHPIARKAIPVIFSVVFITAAAGCAGSDEQEDSPVRGKVCSILYFYENGKAMNIQNPAAPYDTLNTSLYQTACSLPPPTAI